MENFTPPPTFRKLQLNYILNFIALNVSIIKGNLICLFLINLLLSSFFVNQIFGQQQDYLFECSIIDSAQTLGYPEINNHIPPGAEPSCYLASDPCIDRYPFSGNWENINPVTIRLNFHFIKTGDVGLNFGEEDGNCPNCSSNDDRSIYDQANYFIQELNNSAQGMDDFLQYYDENGNKIDPPIRFKDKAGNVVPNLGDTKLRFELYEENGQGSVHIHEIDDYKFENSLGDMQGPCEDGQITLDNPKADFSVYGAHLSKTILKIKKMAWSFSLN